MQNLIGFSASARPKELKAGVLDLLASLTLSSSTPLVLMDFLDIYADTHKHLEIVISGKSLVNSESDTLLINFNGDYGQNYICITNGGTASGNYGQMDWTTDAVRYNGAIPGSLTSSNFFGSSTINIASFSSSDKRKLYRGQTSIASSLLSRNGYHYGIWQSESEISSVSISLSSGSSWQQGSRFDIYGTRAS
jgi:hypothetical protein